MSEDGLVPTESDKAWCAGVLRVIKDGGQWMHPQQCAVYRVDRSRLTLTRTARMVDDVSVPDAVFERDFESRDAARKAMDEMHERNRIAFGAIGWTVLP